MGQVTAQRLTRIDTVAAHALIVYAFARPYESPITPFEPSETISDGQQLAHRFIPFPYISPYMASKVISLGDAGSKEAGSSTEVQNEGARLLRGFIPLLR